MHLTITMNLDNAAFEDGGTDEAKRAIDTALENVRGQWARVGGVNTNIRDINGNKVGTLLIQP